MVENRTVNMLENREYGRENIIYHRTRNMIENREYSGEQGISYVL